MRGKTWLARRVSLPRMVMQRGIRGRGWMTRRGSLLKFVILTFLLCLLCQCIHPSYEPIRKREEGVPAEPAEPVLFIYNDGRAKKVCVAGDFNQWSPQSHCMRRDENIWSLQVVLPPGRYQYLLVIDNNTWRTDPGVPFKEENGFGTENSVLIVE